MARSPGDGVQKRGDNTIELTGVRAPALKRSEPKAWTNPEPLFNGKNIVPTGNVNTAQVNDPKLNAQIEKAKTITDPAASAKAWAALDKVVTNQSYFLTWIWDNNVGLESKDMNGVPSKFNSGEWDLSFSSFKK